MVCLCCIVRMLYGSIFCVLVLCLCVFLRSNVFVCLCDLLCDAVGGVRVIVYGSSV